MTIMPVPLRFRKLLIFLKKKLEALLLGREQAALDATFNTLADIAGEEQLHSDVRTRVVQDAYRNVVEEHFVMHDNLRMAVVPVDDSNTPPWWRPEGFFTNATIMDTDACLAVDQMGPA